MRILITEATRHGSTADIGAVIGAQLEQRNLEIVHAAIERDPDPAAFDGVIVGSAVYMGKWLKPALEWVGKHRDLLATKLIWVFSSGPIDMQGTIVPPEGVLDGIDFGQKPTGMVVFGGRLDRSKLGMRERLISTMVGAENQDHRDWEAIEIWANEIADHLEHLKKQG